MLTVANSSTKLIITSASFYPTSHSHDNMALRAVFMNISPFRISLMRMLRPYDIAKLASALDCDLTQAEYRRFMEVVDDIFPDRSELKKLQDKGCCIHVFGADLEKIQLRLKKPLVYERDFGSSNIHVYFLVSSPKRSLGYTVQPRWVRINSSYSDVNVNIYDNTLTGHFTPWIHMRPDTLEKVLGRPFLHVSSLQPIRQQRIPCICLNGRSQKFIFLYGDWRPRDWMESNIRDRNARRKYPNINFVVVPSWQHTFFMLHI